MIGSLLGKIQLKKAPKVVLDVGGVGYELEAPMTTFYHLPAEDETCFLYTHLVVREDAHQLYGFRAQTDRDLFRILIKVSGVGPKLALAILSTLEMSEFVHYVNEDNSAALVKIPGVGKKTAERLVIEMRDKLKDFAQHLLSSQSRPKQVNEAHPVNDAVSALIALGYKPKQATAAVANCEQDGVTSEQLIKQALRYMMETA